MIFKIFQAKLFNRNQPNELTSGDEPDKLLAQDALSRPRRNPENYRLVLYGGLLGFCALVTLPILHRPACACANSAAALRSQARTYAGSINRAQQAFYLENGSFANHLKDLGLGINDSDSPVYRYAVEASDRLVFNAVIVRELNEETGRKLRNAQELLSYIGAVAVSPQETPERSAIGTQVNEMTTILCQSQQPGAQVPPKPRLLNGKLSCAEGTEEFSW